MFALSHKKPLYLVLRTTCVIAVLMGLSVLGVSAKEFPAPNADQNSPVVTEVAVPAAVGHGQGPFSVLITFLARDTSASQHRTETEGDVLKDDPKKASEEGNFCAKEDDDDEDEDEGKCCVKDDDDDEDEDEGKACVKDDDDDEDEDEEKVCKKEDDDEDEDEGEELVAKRIELCQKKMVKKITGALKHFLKEDILPCCLSRIEECLEDMPAAEIEIDKIEIDVEISNIKIEIETD